MAGECPPYSDLFSEQATLNSEGQTTYQDTKLDFLRRMDCCKQDWQNIAQCSVGVALFLYLEGVFVGFFVCVFKHKRLPLQTTKKYIKYQIRILCFKNITQY